MKCYVARHHSMVKTQQSLFSAIINDNVEMPQLMNFSEATKSCCKGLLAKEPKRRLGHNSEGGPRGLQGHEFFNSIDWKLLKKAQFPPPFLLANYTQTKDATEDIQLLGN